MFQELLYSPLRILKKSKTRVKKNGELKNGVTFQERRRSRRYFFEISWIFVATVALVTLLKRQGRAFSSPFFRPPGSVPESEFLAKCARCGLCVRSCPNKILKLVDIDKKCDDATSTKLKKDIQPSVSLKIIFNGSPQVDFSEGAHYCEKNCVLCGQICPTGAISFLTVEEKASAPIALVELNVEHCMLYYNQECSICRRECPYDAIEIVWNEEEYLNLPLINESVCVGCGQCVLSCPGEPFLQGFGVMDGSTKNERIKALSLVKRK